MDRRSGWKTAWVAVAAGTLCYGVLLGSVTHVTASGSGGSGSGGSGSGGSGSGGGSSDARQFSLAGMRPTDPVDLGNYVVNRAAAIQLGKALFWDQQTGGKGQACASCHYNAGADNRYKNSVNPGFDGTFDKGSPNVALTAGDFPFHKLSDVNNSSSTVMYDTNDVSGSQGVVQSAFINVVMGSGTDNCGDLPDGTFNDGHGHNTRRVTGRNTPTNINAAFNFRNFWDGRARNEFNGVDPHGTDTVGAVIYRTVGGVAKPVSVIIKNASAASQAVGPPNNGTEMACGAPGRSFPQLGQKLLHLMPLGEQKVSTSDSVLGSLAKHGGNGLTVNYAYLIQTAFKADLWNAGETQMENNFSLYWGLAIQLYEDTLVSDQAPIDTGALSASAARGLGLFTGKARCAQCHQGPTFTAATGNNEKAFVNTAVRPVSDDAGGILELNGRFKVPTLRNIELTGPYFHNGGQATLAQVVDFYNRGGDFASKSTDSQIRPLGLSAGDKSDLVAFMMSLTDERVRYRRAPFDGPSLDVPEDGMSGQMIHIVETGAAGTATPKVAAYAPQP